MPAASRSRDRHGGPAWVRPVARPMQSSPRATIAASLQAFREEDKTMKRRHLTLGLAGACAAPLFTALPALAQPGQRGQRDEDDGDFLILRARYGTDAANADVTDRLRELARDDRRFRLTNELFGVDPDPGRTKTLRIFARDRDGRERTFDIREGAWVDGAQFIGWRGGNWGQGGPGGWQGGGNNGNGRDDGEYTILYASYGTGRNEVDVTPRLRELARRDQRFRMGNDTFGVDPDPGRTKILRIVSRDRRGQERVFEYREGAWVDGSQFIGWGGGDWGHGRPERLQIDSASYGAEGRGRGRDVTQALRAQLRGDRLEIQVSNEVLGGDPAPNRRKLLTVNYRVGSRTDSVRVPEGEILRLP